MEHDFLEHQEDIRLEERLKEEMMSEILVPESLSPQAIVEKLKQNGVKPKKRSPLWLRVGAVAASLAIVLGSIQAYRFMTSKSPTLTPGVTEAKEADGYDQIYKAVSSLVPQSTFLDNINNMIRFGFGAKSTTNATADGAAEGTTGNAPAAGASGEQEIGGNPAGQEAFGSTNNQVQGIDESDIVKNDGAYLYIIRQRYDTNPQLAIVDAKKMELVSTISSDSYRPFELFIEGDRLVVLAANQDESGTAAVFYDIANRAEPKKLRTFEQDGYFITARKTQGKLYLVTCHTVSSKPVKDRPSSYVPSCGDTGKKEVVPAGDVVLPEVSTVNQFVVVSGLDISTLGDASTKAVLGSTGSVYMSEKYLYVASPGYDKTQILRFAVGGGVVEATGGVNLAGSVLNQYSMDEHNGYFRVATSNLGDMAQGSQLTIYDDRLEVASSLKNLAPNEKIYSCRFLGDKVYMVTFRTTDPLFVIDASDPSSPRVLGELKIPGFSQYLHPYGDHLLIGFGKSAQDKGEFAYTTGIKLSLFDISDSENPREIHKLELGDSGSSSLLNEDPKALMDKLDGQLIGFPVQLTGKDRFNGYLLVEVTEENGFVVKGKIAHEALGYTPPIFRGTYIGNTLYTISDNQVLATDMASMKNTGRLALSTPEEDSRSGSGPNARYVD